MSQSTKIKGNKAARGGGVSVGELSNFEITSGSEISDNIAIFEGGGVAAEPTSSLKASGGTSFLSNAALGGGVGGGVWAHSVEKVLLERIAMVGNNASSGGGM